MRIRKFTLGIIVTITMAMGVALGLSATSNATVQYGNPGSPAVSCAHLSSHNNWLCVFVPNNGLYWTDNLYTREFYLHNNPVVMEQYFCQNDQEQADGHPTCISNAPGVPANTPQWERRTITLADGCTIYGWVVKSGTKVVQPPAHCVLPNGHERLTTVTERDAILKFWSKMLYVHGYW